MIIKNTKTAFTLAEILITLTILGIIAIIVIPNLIHEYKIKTYVVQLKMAYSIISNAVEMARAEYGDEEWEKNFTKYVGPFLKVKKDCTRKYNQNCTPVTDYVDMFPGAYGFANDFHLCNRKGNFDNNNCFPYKLILHNNMIIYATANGVLLIDINGEKKPNRKNVDLFAFYLDHDKGVTFLDGVTYKEGCVSTGKGAYFDNETNCGKWVLNNGNMDYLKKYTSW